MVQVTSVDAQNRFGELLERAQREPVAVTRHGRTVAYVVGAHELAGVDLAERRAQAARWYAAYCAEVRTPPGPSTGAELSDDDVVQLVHALR